MQSLNKAEGKVNDSPRAAVYEVKIFLLILSSLTSVCVEADNGQRKETPVLTAHVGEPEDTGRFGSKTRLITIRELLKMHNLARFINMRTESDRDLYELAFFFSQSSS